MNQSDYHKLSLSINSSKNSNKTLKEHLRRKLISKTKNKYFSKLGIRLADIVEQFKFFSTMALNVKQISTVVDQRHLEKLLVSIATSKTINRILKEHFRSSPFDKTTI